MKRTASFFLLLISVACGSEQSNPRSPAGYEVVNEGAATGVTGTLGDAGTLEPITGTNADTTTAFTIMQPGMTATGTDTAGSLADQMPMSGSGLPPGMTTPARRPPLSGGSYTPPPSGQPSRPVPPSSPPVTRPAPPPDTSPPPTATPPPTPQPEETPDAPPQEQPPAEEEPEGEQTETGTTSTPPGASAE